MHTRNVQPPTPQIPPRLLQQEAGSFPGPQAPLPALDILANRLSPTGSSCLSCRWGKRSPPGSGKVWGSFKRAAADQNTPSRRLRGLGESRYLSLHGGGRVLKEEVSGRSANVQTRAHLRRTLRVCPFLNSYVKYLFPLRTASFSMGFIAYIRGMYTNTVFYIYYIYITRMYTFTNLQKYIALIYNIASSDESSHSY